MISPAGYCILLLYIGATLLIGIVMRRRSTSADEYLNATRSLPVWAVTLSFLSANCGALEMVGLSAMAAQYGPVAFQFYWLGAIPAMVFFSLCMLPVYLRTGVHSLPEFLERRFDARVRLVNTVVLIVSITLLSGINLYAMAQVLSVVLGWSFFKGAIISTAIVLLYVFLGGIRATIYNEILQLAVIVLGLAPLAITIARAHRPLIPPGMHLWSGLPVLSASGRVDVFGLCFGLGFVLSFSYWCTDFVLMQRALATRDAAAAPYVPLLAGFGKLAFSGLVVLPGLAAAYLLHGPGPQRFDQVLPTLMARLYSPTLLGLGVTALLASLMSGLAANISALPALFTADLYRPHLRPGKSDRHYLTVGQIATVLAAGFSVIASYITFRFGSLMEYVQLIFSLFSAPFFAIFLFGLLSKRLTARGAFIGLCGGIGIGLAHQALVISSVLHYGSAMTGNFYVAIYSFTGTLLISLATSHGRSQDPMPLMQWPAIAGTLQHTRRSVLWTTAATLLAVTLVLNVLAR